MSGLGAGLMRTGPQQARKVHDCTAFMRHGVPPYCV